MTISCDINAGMERLIRISANQEYDLSAHSTYAVYLNVQSGTPETRTLSIVNRSTSVELLSINLNDSTAKPVNNETSAYQPTERPNLVEGYEVDADQYRVFYAEENLSADTDVDVVLRIIPDQVFPNIGDDRRYLQLSGNNPALPSKLQQIEIDLNNDGGKKPLGGPGGAMRVTRDAQGDAVRQ